MFVALVAKLTLKPQNYGANVNGFTPSNDISWMTEFSGTDGPSMLSAPTSITPGFMDVAPQQYLNGNNSSSVNIEAFQQPFVPQDLWQMPMTLEWDWADLTAVNPLGLSSDDMQVPNGQ